MDNSRFVYLSLTGLDNNQRGVMFGTIQGDRIVSHMLQVPDNGKLVTALLNYKDRPVAAVKESPSYIIEMIEEKVKVLYGHK